MSISWRNTPQQYGVIAIALHWLMVPLIFAMFLLGWWMVGLDYYDRWYHDAPELHKSFGMVLLVLLVIRICWRLGNPLPEAIGRWWEQRIALLVHRSHYLLLLVVVISGYLIPTAQGVGITVFGWFTVPAILSFDQSLTERIGWIHRDAAWGVMALAVLHAAAALKHHIVDRDPALLRMLGMARNLKPRRIETL